MASLHEVTNLTKKALGFIGLGIIGIIVLVIIIQIGQNIKNSLFPTPPTPPNVKFGKLSAFSFPQGNIDGSNFTYTINTLSGSLPILPDRATVYKMIQPQPSFQSFQNASTLLNKIGFINKPTSFSDTTYQWTKDTPFFTKIIYNILTNNFMYTSNYATSPAILAAQQITDQQSAVTASTLFFSSFLPLPSDIDPTKAQTSIFAINNGTLIPAQSLSGTQIIRTDFFQNDINSLHIYYPNYPKSLMYTLVGSGDQQLQVVEAKYIYQGVDTSQSATYPIKTAAQAFDELKNNKAYIANYDGKGNTITIRDVTLGYYIGEQQQNYLIPIIVFLGDNNFYAYVSAIDDQWFQTQ